MMTRNQYNRISNPPQNIKRKKGIKTKEDIKYNTTQSKGQQDRSFPADGHQAILNKDNKG